MKTKVKTYLCIKILSLSILVGCATWAGKPKKGTNDNGDDTSSTYIVAIDRPSDSTGQLTKLSFDFFRGSDQAYDEGFPPPSSTERSARTDKFKF